MDDGPRSTTRIKVIQKGGGAGVYGLGFLGALVHYLQVAATFWAGVVGVVKALLWPAFLVYEALRFLNAK